MKHYLSGFKRFSNPFTPLFFFNVKHGIIIIKNKKGMRQTLIFNFLLSVLLINSLSLAGQSFDVIPLPATRANSVSPDGKAVSGNVGNQSFIWTEEDGLTLLVAPPEFTSFIIGDVANEGIAAAIS